MVGTTPFQYSLFLFLSAIDAFVNRLAHRMPVCIKQPPSPPFATNFGVDEGALPTFFASWQREFICNWELFFIEFRANESKRHRVPLQVAHFDRFVVVCHDEPPQLFQHLDPAALLEVFTEQIHWGCRSQLVDWPSASGRKGGSLTLPAAVRAL